MALTKEDKDLIRQLAERPYWGDTRTAVHSLVSMVLRLEDELRKKQLEFERMENAWRAERDKLCRQLYGGRKRERQATATLRPFGCSV